MMHWAAVRAICSPASARATAVRVCPSKMPGAVETRRRAAWVPAVHAALRGAPMPTRLGRGKRVLAKTEEANSK
jgi:hypothetical protein